MLDTEERTINISNNRILTFTMKKDYAYNTYSIKEYFLDNNELIKNYELNRWDDYSFNAYIDNYEESNQISFEIDINNPLYFPFLHLLGKDKSLIIDDDDTLEDKQKYLEIKKDKTSIVLNFINNLEELMNYEKFNIFVKNIVYDGRSKIDRDYRDTKERLHKFFMEVREVLLEEYHQITFEEYIEKQKVLKK